jgi:galactose mutarotase-like enzyme
MPEEVVTRIENENVLIQIGDCTVTILPQFGGKISSILVRGHELLQAPLAPYAPRTRIMSFDEGDASGWDECLPSVARCTAQTVNGPVDVPDHGDLWRVAWQVLTSANGSISMQGDCFSLPLKLLRTITLTQTEKGYRLQADYQVTNTSATETPWAWSAHAGYASEAGDRVILPDSIKTLRLEGSGGGRLGKGGDTVAWPVAKLVTGGETNLSIATPPESNTGDKLFAGPLAAAENWCALERPKAGVRLRIRFDPALTPYLGVWICNGGWPDRPGTKQHCVALEPATAPVDSLGLTGPWSRTLAAGESFTWPMTVDLEFLYVTAAEMNCR